MKEIISKKTQKPAQHQKSVGKKTNINMISIILTLYRNNITLVKVN
jgi:hypothetical protein